MRLQDFLNRKQAEVVYMVDMQGQAPSDTAKKGMGLTYGLMVAMLLVMAGPVVVQLCFSSLRVSIFAAVVAAPFLAVLYVWTIRRCMRQAAELPGSVFAAYLFLCFLPATLFLLGVGCYLLFGLPALLRCLS